MEKITTQSNPQNDQIAQELEKSAKRSVNYNGRNLFQNALAARIESQKALAEN